MRVGLTTSAGTENISGVVDVSASPDPANLVTSMEIYVDDVLVTTFTSAPYVYSWDTDSISGGTHQLKARARYKRHNYAETKLTVLIGTPPPPPAPPEPPIDDVPVAVEE